jgi:hypothetical protein
MASPKIEVFWLFNAGTGVPLTGATPTFTYYADTSGTPLAQPSITEIGGGAYKFTPSVSANQGIVYTIDAGVSSGNRYIFRHIREEDWNNDAIPDVLSIVERIQLLKEGRWKVHSSGLDANRLVLYSSDGTTALQKWDLKDLAGSPTIAEVFERVPVLPIP